MSALTATDLVVDVQPHFWSKKRRLLHGVSLEARRGEILGFLGPNGAGKTTTIKTLLGLVRPVAGDVTVLGGRLSDPAVRRRVGFMPEHAYFPDHLTSREVVREHALLAGYGWREAKRRADETLERAGLGHARQRRLGGYSKGMLQRVGIAQALVGDPELVILDEPMSGLDPVGRRDMRNVMLSLREAGKTVFFSTHIIPDVEVICDRVVIMVGGTVRRTGALHEMLAAEAGVESVDVTAVRCDDVTLGRAREVCPTVETHGDSFRFSARDYERAEALMQILRDGGARVLALQAHRRSLEDVFVSELGGAES